MQATSNPGAFDQKKMVILVVEDEEDTRKLILDALSMDGLSCITASSVAEALRALKTNHIALTILDWRLDRCGAEVLEESTAHYPQMPVIVVSGSPHDVRTDAIVGRADAFLEKPFSATVLSCQVMQLLKRAERDIKSFLPKRPEDIRPLAEISELYVWHVVRMLGDNISLAAEKLGIHRQTVSDKVKRAATLEPDLELPQAETHLA